MPYPFKSSATSATRQRLDTTAARPGASSASSSCPKIHELILGIDGLNLFAATSTGVMRLALG